MKDPPIVGAVLTGRTTIFCVLTFSFKYVLEGSALCSEHHVMVGKGIILALDDHICQLGVHKEIPEVLTHLPHSRTVVYFQASQGLLPSKDSELAHHVQSTFSCEEVWLLKSVLMDKFCISPYILTKLMACPIAQFGRGQAVFITWALSLHTTLRASCMFFKACHLAQFGRGQAVCLHKYQVCAPEVSCNMILCVFSSPLRVDQQAPLWVH